MSKPNPLEEAESEYKYFLGQRAELEKKLAGLQKQAAAWGNDFTNLDQAVNEIGKNAAQAEAINAALILLLPKIHQAKLKMDALTQADRLAQAAAFEPIIDNAVKSVAGAVVNLSQALADLDRVQADYRKISGFFPTITNLPLNDLRKVIKFFIESLAHHRPELLGLPPLPTPAELRKMEARERLDRMKNRLESVKSKRDIMGRSTDFENALELAEHDYLRAKKQYEALN